MNVADLDAGPALDAELIWYFSVVSDGRASTRARFLTEPRLRAATITDTVDCLRDRRGRLPVWAALHVAENPGAPAELLHDWATDPNVDASVRRATATNPRLGLDAAQLFCATGPGVGEWFLANRGADPEFINERWSTAPHHALANPRCGPVIVNAEHLLHPEALTHPGIEEAIRRSALTSRSLRRRFAVLRNPNTTCAELESVLRSERRDPDPSARIITSVESILDMRRWEVDPFSCRAGLLNRCRWHPAVHTALRSLDAEALDTVSALMRSRFTGTVAELLDVATTFT